MTAEVAAALHAEAHAMSRALAALNRAIAACKAHERKPAPIAPSAGKKQSDAQRCAAPQRHNSTCGGIMHSNAVGSERAACAQSAKSNDQAGASIQLQQAQCPGQCLRESDSHPQITNVTVGADIAAAGAGTRHEAPQPEAVVPSVSEGSVGAADGFQLGQQHLIVQDVDELLQPCTSDRPGALAKDTPPKTKIQPQDASTSCRSPLTPGAKPPRSQQTPTHSQNTAERVCPVSGTGGNGLPGCIPDTPSGSEGPAGQPHCSPGMAMHLVCLHTTLVILYHH